MTALEAEIVSLKAQLLAVLRDANWFISWIAYAGITPREAGMDVQARKWLAAHKPEGEQEVTK